MKFSKKLLKMIFANVKVNVKQLQIKELVAVSYKFLWKVPSKLEIECENDMDFSFNFGWYSILLNLLK